MFSLFLPGIEHLAADPRLRLPVLEALLGRGRSRRLADSPWALLAELAGGSLASWPVAPVSALGELPDPPRACLRLEPLGADAEQGSAFRIPAAQLAIAAGEATALARAFAEPFAADGLTLIVAAPERWYLGWDPAATEGRDWRGFAGPARCLPTGARPAPPEPTLRRLLSEVELLFHAHPVNAARRERGAPTIAGLHAWGGGCLPAVQSPVAGPVTPVPAAREPYLAGLCRLGAVTAEMLADNASNAAAGRMAWPLAVELPATPDGATLAADWILPLARRLWRGQLRGLRIVTSSRVTELTRLDAWRLWRRPRALAE
jgi:hypothetical protein